jgi:hypothetical protein
VIEQIPVVTFAVTLGRTHRVRSELGTVSFHHLAPELFGGAQLEAAWERLVARRRRR